ncbi:hypothetical protein [Corynebacterium auriscanis]|uniref:hypothetical protein n=1 Tax=Corynebacterium auriscanis TaxID=99807 RepID=UPI0024ADDD83|nr:hypothetical protein [Corynebacterium auriscanis]
MITVTPYLEIDGAQITCKSTALDSAPVVMDGITIQWGRDGYFDAAEPARLSVRLWDATGTWAKRIRDSRALGLHTTLHWGFESGGGVAFRGVIAAASARPTTERTESNRLIWQINIECVDPTATLGNVFPLPGVLAGGQTMEERKQWLMGLAAYGGLQVADIDYQSGYSPAKTKPVKVGGDSALQLLTEFYDSMSKDAFTYDHENNSIRQCERHDGDFTTYLASFDDSRGAVMIAASDTVIDNVARPGVALSGCRLELPDGMDIAATAETDINRVESTWADPADSWNEKVAFKESVAVGQPRRLLSNSTWLTTGWAIELQLQSAWDRARAEGRRPRHPRIRHRAGKQFATERLARWWLRCWEDTRPAFINGDLAHEWLMQDATAWPPLVSPLGGTVEYTYTDGWTIELAVQWMNDRTAVNPMTWAALQQVQWTTTTSPVPWWYPLLGIPSPPPKTVGTPTPERDVYWGTPEDTTTTAQRQYRFDESVTWADLRYLDNSDRQIKDVLT